jgi:hypothetical protein
MAGLGRVADRLLPGRGCVKTRPGKLPAENHSSRHSKTRFSRVEMPTESAQRPFRPPRNPRHAMFRRISFYRLLTAPCFHTVSAPFRPFTANRGIPDSCHSQQGHSAFRPISAIHWGLRALPSDRALTNLPLLRFVEALIKRQSVCAARRSRMFGYLNAKPSCSRYPRSLSRFLSAEALATRSLDFMDQSTKGMPCSC